MLHGSSIDNYNVLTTTTTAFKPILLEIQKAYSFKSNMLRHTLDLLLTVKFG